jgi:hypothetical protein
VAKRDFQTGCFQNVVDKSHYCIIVVQEVTSLSIRYGIELATLCYCDIPFLPTLSIAIKHLPSAHTERLGIVTQYPTCLEFFGSIADATVKHFDKVIFIASCFPRSIRRRS